MVDFPEAVSIHDLAFLEGQLNAAQDEFQKIDVLNKHAWGIRHSFPNKALTLSLKARESSVNLGYKSGIAYSFRCTGAAYSLLSQFQIGLADLQRAFVLFFELGNKQAIATTLRNIGNVYKSLGQTEKALEHYYNALRFAKEVEDDQGEAYIYTHIGETLYFKGNLSGALEYMEKALTIHNNRKDEFGIANSYTILGSILLATGEKEGAHQLFLKSDRICNHINDLHGLAKANVALGGFYSEQGDYPKALRRLQSAIAAATEMGEKNLISQIFKAISDVYALLGNYQQAWETYKHYDEVRTQVQNLNTEITLRTLQAQFELEQSEKEKEIYKFKNQELARANRLIESKNRDITDSIRYAKHIQEAILPERSYMAKYLNEFFIFYKPKDIVSGDFYWFYEKYGLLYLAAVDCTGHGVPGAFISIVGGNLLRMVVKEDWFTDAAAVLNEINRLFNQNIRQTFEESAVKDGMDMAFCIIDQERMKLSYSGAFNPLYLIRNGELHVFKANKFPVGSFIGDELKEFQSIEIDLFEGDQLYLFSDGFNDQFGGPKNKKIMPRRFKDILLENHQLPMKLQQFKLETFFEEWKGSNDQVDDILVMGIKI